MAEEKKATTAKSKDQAPKDLMGFLDYYLVKKAPIQIPTGGREWLVKALPWINIIILVLFLPAILLVLGIGTLVVPFAGTGVSGFSLAALVLIVQVVLMAAAIPGLFGRRMVGWNLSFYSVVVNVVYSLVNLDIISALFSAVISSYLLFQIRSYYKKS
jgi:hypothetical protein